MIFSGIPVFAVETHAGREEGDFFVVRRYRSAVTVASENLEGIEAPAAGQPPGPGSLVIDARSQTLAGVFDDDQVMFFGYRMIRGMSAIQPLRCTGSRVLSYP